MNSSYTFSRDEEVDQTETFPGLYINLLAEWCESGVQVVSVTQQIDLTGPVSRMVTNVMFGLAEIELEYRRERQATRILVAKKRGIYQGRKKGTTKAKSQRVRPSYLPPSVNE